MNTRLPLNGERKEGDWALSLGLSAGDWQVDGRLGATDLEVAAGNASDRVSGRRNGSARRNHGAHVGALKGNAESPRT